MLPKIWNYGRYSSDNYGAHTLAVQVGDVTMYYSYKTLVAFQDWSNGHGLIVSQNIWGTTTGKHLNWIDEGNKGHRLPPEQFQAAWDQCLKDHNL